MKNFQIAGLNVEASSSDLNLFLFFKRILKDMIYKEKSTILQDMQ